MDNLFVYSSFQREQLMNIFRFVFLLNIVIAAAVVVTRDCCYSCCSMYFLLTRQTFAQDTKKNINDEKNVKNSHSET